MTDPIKFDPALHVIVPRVATDEQYRKADEAFWERKHSGRNVCYESIYNAMIAAAPPITINAPLGVTKAEAVEILHYLHECHDSEYDYKTAWAGLTYYLNTITRLLEAASK